MGLGVTGQQRSESAPESALTCHDHTPNRRRSTTLRRPYASLRNRVRDDVCPVRKLVQISCPPFAFARPTERTLSTSKHVRVHPVRCAMLARPRRRTDRPPASEKIEHRDRRRPHRLGHLGARRGRIARPAPGRGGHARQVARARRLADERRARPRQGGRGAAARGRAAAGRRARRRRRRVTSNASRSPVPGFVNFFLAPTWLHEVLVAAVADGDALRAR